MCLLVDQTQQKKESLSLQINQQKLPKQKSKEKKKKTETENRAECPNLGFHQLKEIVRMDRKTRPNYMLSTRNPPYI